MSASLVGSEMCIRDRPHSGHGVSSHGAPRHLRVGYAYPSSIRSRAASAVSYTHLTLPTICSV
eukprot:8860391-Alexandrium_andersonii.AAC.1